MLPRSTWRRRLHNIPSVIINESMSLSCHARNIQRRDWKPFIKDKDTSNNEWMANVSAYFSKLLLSIQLTVVPYHVA